MKRVWPKNDDRLAKLNQKRDAAALVSIQTFFGLPVASPVHVAQALSARILTADRNNPACALSKGGCWPWYSPAAGSSIHATRGERLDDLEDPFKLYRGHTIMNCTKAYLGTLDMDVNFNSDTLSGSAGNFVEYFSLVASPTTGSNAPGSLTISGNLTGSNETLTSGISGTAVGSVDGTALNMNMTGNLTGLGAEGMMLWFNDTITFGNGGIALATQ